MADAAKAARSTSSRFSIESLIALLAIVAIVMHLVMRYALRVSGDVRGTPTYELPLIAALLIGGLPLVAGLARNLLRRQFSSDLLAGISIVTSVILGEYLAGTLVVLMLSGGEALESYAVRNASSVLNGLARRVPSVAHVKRDGDMSDVALDEVAVGDTVVIFPHEISPVDGTVIEGHGSMDESYLTGEPYVMSKVPGSSVLSGAINAESALTIRADRRAIDSRYAKIMQVMRESEQRRPKLRRLGDQLGAVYTPVAVGIALAAWAATGDPIRFLSVLVVATPCPLLIAIPVAIIGSISLAARRGIIIKDPAILEKIGTCRIAMFDKTGTLTYGQPKLTEIVAAEGVDSGQVLSLVGSLERYSRHPLAAAVIESAKTRSAPLRDAQEVSERPGEGLRGVVDGKRIQVTSRRGFTAQHPDETDRLPPLAGGMECVVLIDEGYAATFHFRDEPREDGVPFISHLARKHRFERVMLISGDRESEVRYLADKVGIKEVHAGQSPEQKLALVREATKHANTVFLGDGINDAPALTAATVGIAFGQGSDITTEAAGAVILDSSLARVDELMHIGHRMRTIALQSAVGGMVLSVVGMLFAAAGYLPPVAGAITQEAIDVFAVVNALRVAIKPKALTDY
ncbi:MAG: cadmium-translocating P-type ATPase [Candidatus Latescibacteria bacterium]|nr:cadmium-translocating P-type ATPase [Candidatus Latescibacterota bacterium]